MSILINTLLVIFVLVALLMILVILMQRPKSEGLGAAFGGGVTENIFGAQTTNVLTRITSWLAGIFFIITFTLSMLYAHQTNTSSSALRSELMKGQPNAATVPTPATAPSPTKAVGAPGTVTNPTPGNGGPAAAPTQPLTPSDQAVGVSQPAPAPANATPPVAGSEATAAPAASAQPSP